MVEQDTIKLLRECDAGVKMGVTSIDDVRDYVHNESFKIIGFTDSPGCRSPVFLPD